MSECDANVAGAWATAAVFITVIIGFTVFNCWKAWLEHREVDHGR